MERRHCLERSCAWTETMTQTCHRNFKIKVYLNNGDNMNRCIHFASMLFDHWSLNRYIEYICFGLLNFLLNKGMWNWMSRKLLVKLVSLNGSLAFADLFVFFFSVFTFVVMHESFHHDSLLWSLKLPFAFFAFVKIKGLYELWMLFSSQNYIFGL